MRIEHDCLGELQIPEKVYYGIQTQRAKNNFDVSGHTFEEYPVFIRSIAAIKKAAAMANRDIGMLNSEVTGAICQAADEILDGSFIGEFPIDVFQGGGGTSTNMNVNEVIANRANEILTGNKGYDTVHPNSHVNMGQSTNDVIPSAMTLSCYLYVKELIASLEHLEKCLKKKEEEFKSVVKVSRTCIQDAVPITLGQEFSGYRSFILRHIALAKESAEECTILTLGATASGTSLGAFPGYINKVYENLGTVTGVPVRKNENFFDGMQNGDAYVRISGVLKSLATGLGKMARDFRIMSSGPRAGFKEIELPPVQPGSSIMPGKINPVMPELINQICYQVCGNDFAITMAAEGGELDLNVWEPVIIKCISESFRLLTNGSRLFADLCVAGIKPNTSVCQSYAESSIAISTVISALFGYEAGTKIAQEAFATGESVKEVSIKNGLLTREEADILMDPLMLTDYEQSSKVIAVRRDKG